MSVHVSACVCMCVCVPMQITSLFQHLTPALVAWLLRWQAPQAVRGWDNMSPADREAMGQAGFMEMTVWPMGVWAVWAVIYYVLVSGTCAGKLST